MEVRRRQPGDAREFNQINGLAEIAVQVLFHHSYLTCREAAPIYADRRIGAGIGKQGEEAQRQTVSQQPITGLISPALHFEQPGQRQ